MDIYTGFISHCPNLEVTCDIVIYSKKYIYGLCFHCWHRTPEALFFIFLSDTNTWITFFSNEGTLGVFLKGSWFRANYQKDQDQAMIRSLEFSAPLPIFQRMERG